MSKISRRRFLATSGAVAGAPWIIAGSSLGADGVTPPSDRITVGCVGLGMQGLGNLRTFLLLNDAQVVAVCDVQELHYRENPWGTGPTFGREPARKMVDGVSARRFGKENYAGCAALADYRELCSLPDLDAVVVSTPDHWHYLIAMEALRAGKDVYGEKPVTHYFAEGVRLCDEVAARKAVFQVGSQQRSLPIFRQAVEVVRNGHLGEIRQIEVGLPDGYDQPKGDHAVAPIPEGLDYETWCGPGPMLPYCQARHHRWWRGWRGYGGGTLMDWIGHHNDIAHWGLGLDRVGPKRVEVVQWTAPATKVYNTPVHYEILSEHPGGVTVSIADHHKLGVKFIGEEGWLFVTREGMAASDPRWTKPNFARGPFQIPDTGSHHRNFIDSVKSRVEPVAPAAIAHRSVTPGHLAYAAQAVGRPLDWDAENQQVVDDSEASALLQSVPYREPWAF